MKAISILLVLGAAASTHAAVLPLCSAVCLTEAIASTGCKASNTKCICTSETFLPTVEECVQNNCNEADKDYTLEAAEQFCGATGAHTQLLKRDAAPEPEPESELLDEPENEDAELVARGFWRFNWGKFGWRRPRRTNATRWVPDFKTHGSEWWKEHSAKWWRINGYDWWWANGHHFPGQKWWTNLSPKWWTQNAGQWRDGPSNSNGGSSSGGSGTSSGGGSSGGSSGGSGNSDNGGSNWSPSGNNWEDWSPDNGDFHFWPRPVKPWPKPPPVTVTITETSGPTATPPPTHTDPPKTHSAEPWTSYTTTAPVQTVLPWKDW